MNKSVKIKIGTSISRYAIVIITFMLFAIFSIVAENFFSISNVTNLLRQVSINGICAVGMACVILTGGIDLTVGGIIGVTGVMCSFLMTNGINPIIASVITLILGILIGLFNAFLISKIRIAPIIATLGVNTALRGAAYLITDGKAIFGFPTWYNNIGQGYVGFIPIPVIIMTVTFAAGVVFLTKTRFSRHIYGVGGNAEVARLSGINVNKVIMTVYSIAGFCAALAGLIMLGRVSSGQPKAGEGYEMDIITATVMGGISLTGGEGKIHFVIFGVLVIGILSNGMTMMGISAYWQRVVKGLVLLLAVGMDRYIQYKKTQDEH